MTFASRHAGLAAAYDGITAAVAALDDCDLQRPTRCRGWLVSDLLFHVNLDAQRALVALASPDEGPADVDHVGYWTAVGNGSDDGGRHAIWVRRSASAFERPSGVVRLWRDTAPAAVRAAGAADPDGFVTTQGHVLSVPDLVATLVVEAVIHHLDLVVELPDAPPPDPRATGIALETLDGLLGADVRRPAGWSSTDYLLKASGRLPLDTAERATLGTAAERFPLIG